MLTATRVANRCGARGSDRVTMPGQACEWGKIGGAFGRPGRQVLAHLPWVPGLTGASLSPNRKGGPAVPDRTHERPERNRIFVTVTRAGGQ